jgi:hypothetical protein
VRACGDGSSTRPCAASIRGDDCKIEAKPCALKNQAGRGIGLTHQCRDGQPETNKKRKLTIWAVITRLELASHRYSHSAEAYVTETHEPRKAELTSMKTLTRLWAVLVCVLLLASCGSPTPPREARGAAGTVYVVDDELYWSAIPGFTAEYIWVGFDSPEEWSKVSSRSAGSRVAIAGFAVRDSSQVGFHLDPATTRVDVGGVPEEFHNIGAVRTVLDRYPPGQQPHVFLIVQVVDFAD